MFKNIIIATDGSDHAKKAASVGFDLAIHYSASVTLMHVPHGETAAFVVGAVPGYHAAITKPSHDEMLEAGQKVLDAATAAAKKAGVVLVETQMPQGDAATEIVKHANQTKADLIITGRRGLSTISSLIMGSTTQRINQMAKCATLSVV